MMKFDRRHNETPDFLRIAKKRWGKAASITGNGRYALVARCDVTTITLWADLNIAKSSQKVNELMACGEMCSGTPGHQIVDLAEGGSALSELESSVRT